jgi:hypothetical protein
MFQGCDFFSGIMTMVSGNKLSTASVVILSSIIVVVTCACLVMFHGSPGYMSLLAMLFILSLIKAVVSISVVNQKEKLSDMVINRLFENSESKGQSSVGRTAKKMTRSASGPVVDFRDEEISVGFSTPPAESPHAEEISVGFSTPPAESYHDEELALDFSAPLVESPHDEELALDVLTLPAESLQDEEISVGFSTPPAESYHDEELALDFSAPLVESPHDEELALDVLTLPAESLQDEDISVGFSTPPAESYHYEDISIGLSELTLDRYLELSNFALSDEIMSAIEWKRFELLCHLVFRASGFNSRLTGDGADEGVDIRIYDKENSTEVLYLVQCKKWNKKSKIDRPLIQQLRGQMAAENVEKGGYCVTSSFTTPAVEFAASSNIELFDQQTIIKSFNKFDTPVRAKILKQLLEGDYWTPSCATCGRKFSVRTTRSGKRVWACVGSNGHGWNSISYYEAAPITPGGLYSA